jgi:hypothetical protein
MSIFATCRTAENPAVSAHRWGIVEVKGWMAFEQSGSLRRDFHPVG